MKKMVHSITAILVFMTSVLAASSAGRSVTPPERRVVTLAADTSFDDFKTFCGKSHADEVKAAIVRSVCRDNAKLYKPKHILFLIRGGFPVTMSDIDALPHPYFDIHDKANLKIALINPSGEEMTDSPHGPLFGFDAGLDPVHESDTKWSVMDLVKWIFSCGSDSTDE